MRIPPIIEDLLGSVFLLEWPLAERSAGVFLLYIFGVWQEKHTALIHKQREEIVDLKNEIKIWQEEYKEINKRNIEQLTVQKINVKITNWEKYNLDSLSVFRNRGLR